MQSTFSCSLFIKKYWGLFVCELEKYKENRGAYKHTYSLAMLVQTSAMYEWTLAPSNYAMVDVWTCQYLKVPMCLKDCCWRVIFGK